MGDKEILYLRTSDRRMFRRCPRKWYQMSSWGKNLVRADRSTDAAAMNINFWFGSGIHYALEDYHCSKPRYADPVVSLIAYYAAHEELGTLPADAPEFLDLGVAMLSYYKEWYQKHNSFMQFETAELEAYEVTDEYGRTYERFCLRGAPIELQTSDGSEPMARLQDGVEVSFAFPLKHTGALASTPAHRILNSMNKEVWYRGTIDRVVSDRNGKYWLLDYKTAKGADLAKLATDDQVDAYLWAASEIFDFPIEGFIYLQLTKEKIRPMKRLQNGSLSVDMKQKTTASAAKMELLEEYGSQSKIPAKYIEFINKLLEQETEEGDRFIRWDMIKRPNSAARNDFIRRTVQGEIHLMLQTMLTPSYAMAVPTRDCSWDCPCRDWCIADMDQDENFLTTFAQEFIPASEASHVQSASRSEDEYRAALPEPDEIDQDMILESLEAKITQRGREIDFATDDEFVFKFE